MTRPRCWILGVVALACLASCGPTRAEADPSRPTIAPPVVPPSTRFEQDMMVRFHMHENFGLLHVIERLLVHGKLDQARELAGAMAQAPDEPGLATWAIPATKVRERATDLANATTVDEALREEAKLAAACAGCHVDASAQPEFDKPPTIPADQPTVAARMARHLWASDRLWEGMLGSADESWRAGLDVLAATPLPASELGAERTALARQLQRLASDTRKRSDLRDPGARATAYAALLVTCAACHAKRSTAAAKPATSTR